MTDLQPLPIEECSVPWKGRNWREPRAKGPRLLLQCENGINVPLVVVPASRNALEVDGQLLAPDVGCGFGVFSFPKPVDTPAQRRASSTPTPDRNTKTSWERGMSLSSPQKNQWVNNVSSIEKSYRPDTVKAPFLCAGVPELVADRTGKIDILNAIAANNPAVASKYGYRPTPSGVQPDTDKKEYCSYWIRTGECDYTQQGCRYKHEMPDIQTLNRIGFRDFPAWWKRRLFKRPARPQNEILKKILAQESESESSSDDAGSKASPVRVDLSASTNGTPKRQCVDCLSHAESLRTTPDLPDLIDLEPINPQQIERKSLQETPRVGRFIPYNEAASSHSSTTIHPVSCSPTPPPLPFGSSYTPTPTVPHPTPATSPEQKPAKLRPERDQEGSDILKIAESYLLVSANSSVAPSNLTAATSAKTIKPEDLQHQIENLKRYCYDVKQAASTSRSVTPVQAAKPNKTELRLSKHAKSSESDDAKPSSRPSVEGEKRRKWRKEGQMMRANERAAVPRCQSAARTPRKPMKVADGARKATDEQPKESVNPLVSICEK